jgi:hypothetical protein
MKKLQYPLWMVVLIVLLCVMYLSIVLSVGSWHDFVDPYTVFVSGILAGVYVALIIGLLSAVFILREKEALYMVVLLSMMIVFFELVSGLHTGHVMLQHGWMYVGTILVHLVLLWKLSYMCFGAVMG